MNKIILLIISLFPMGLVAQTSIPNVQSPKEINIKTAHQKAIFLLEKNEFEEVRALFNENLKENLCSKKIQSAWDKYYPSDSLRVLSFDFAVKEIASGNTYITGFQIGEEKYDLKTKIDTSSDALFFSSFLISAHQSRGEWKAPMYSDTSKFKCIKTTVGDELPLLAKFCKSKLGSKSNFPIVVMVHGSGPNDMDESLGPNKLFKDLAYGLATNGVASLRYNKRSYDYAAEMAKEPRKLTANTLVIDDAVAAIEKARELTDGKVYLLGHSLGGYFAPAIAERAKPEGVILMAGNISPIEDLLIDQFDYIRENDSSSQISDFMYNSIKWQIKNLKGGNFDSTTVGAMLPLGIPGNFWLSIKEYKPGSVASKQNIPYLVLNGSRDYQVTTEEANKWKQQLPAESTLLVNFEVLNHMFYAGEGVLLPSEYSLVANMDKEVLTVILNWIKHEK